jgi:Raf kinase inhibitor-like YbhB/YbcL family protein
MGIVQDAVQVVEHVFEKGQATADDLVSRRLGGDLPARIQVASIAFEPGGQLPVSCTVDGVAHAPPITWSDVPEGTQSVVLICEDPDAPFPEPFVHWIVYGIPPDVNTIDAQTAVEFRQGENSKEATGYTPVAPPPGHGVHHYHFQVFALDTKAGLQAGVPRETITEFMQGHILAWGELIGTYERPAAS